MSRILVTGGTGTLGRELVGRLVERGSTVRIMSRRERMGGEAEQAEWAQADLESETGLHAALTGVDTIIHAASSPNARTQQIDVEGTRRLLRAAQVAGVHHCVYVSIVGIDAVSYAYYRHKLATEAVVRESAVPWSIQRITQFHPFVDFMIRKAARLPIMFLPTDFQIQPIDTGEAAERLIECVADGPGGQCADIGGPEVLTLGKMVNDWMAAGRGQRRVIHLPLPGRFAAGCRAGGMTCPNQRYGHITWAEWLRSAPARHAARSNASGMEHI